MFSFLDEMFFCFFLTIDSWSVYQDCEECIKLDPSFSKCYTFCLLNFPVTKLLLSAKTLHCPLLL